MAKGQKRDVWWMWIYKDGSLSSLAMLTRADAVYWFVGTPGRPVRVTITVDEPKKAKKKGAKR